MTGESIAAIPRWLLEALVDAMIDAIVLRQSLEFLQEDFNQHIPPFDLEDLERPLLRAVADGFLEILEQKGTVDHALRSLDQSQLDKLIRESPRQTVWLALTPLGGREWEVLSNACWERYVEFRLEYNDQDECVYIIEGMSHDRVLTVYNNAHLLDCNLTTVGEEWSLERPWEVRYWKTLPFAFKVTFVCTERMEVVDEPAWLTEFSRWHD
jgi:hypothetical protein